MNPAELEEDLPALVRSTHVPVAVFDEACRFTFVNEALAQLHGRSIREHIGCSIGAVAPSLEQLARDTVTHVVETGDSLSVTMEHAHRSFLVFCFRFRSRDAGLRVGTMWTPARAGDDTKADCLSEETGRIHGHAPIVHTSRAMRNVMELAETVANTSATVLISGESGVGKELVARAIHQASSRRNASLVKVNCASIPRELFESEFFGHVRGAFSGAVRDRVGRFELANGGTLFLDEVGEIPLAEQAKLLRVLQEGEFERIGDTRTRRVDVRIVAATNRRLEREVEAGRFRKDLYFRLNVFPIEVPALRARPDDIIPLAEHFIGLSAARCGVKGLTLSERCRDKLLRYAWPGNVRELVSVVERSVILARDGRLQISLPEVSPPISTFPRALAAQDAVHPYQAVGSVASLRRLEVEMIEDALRNSGGRVSGKNGAAERLGLNPSTLRDRIKALGVRRPS